MYFDDDDCGATATLDDTPKPVTDEQIDKFLREVRPEDRDTLRRCIHQQIANMGYMPRSVREEGRVWESARRTVAENLIRGGMSVADIEWSEEDNAKKAKRVKAD